MKTDNLKILVIRFSAIGDIVLTLPILSAVRKKFPTAEIHFLTKKIFHGLLEENPEIDKIIYLDRNFSEIKNTLLLEGYRYIIDLHNNFRTLILRWYFIGRKNNPTFLTYHKYWLKRWLLIHLKIDLKIPHIVDRYFGAVASLGIINDASPKKMSLPKNYTLPDGLSLPFVVLVMGTNHYTKTIPPNKLKEIVESIDEKIVLIGGSDEVQKGEILAKSYPEKVISLCGKTSLMESACIINEAIFVVTPDTGMMHIAASLAKKIYLVWGNTTPSLGFTPYVTSAASKVSFLENTNLPCRPCHKHGQDYCPKGHFACMQDIKINFED